MRSDLITLLEQPSTAEVDVEAVDILFVSQCNGISSSEKWEFRRILLCSSANYNQQRVGINSCQYMPFYMIAEEIGVEDVGRQLIKYGI